MDKRDVIRIALAGKRPPYVPWSMGFTLEAKAKLQAHYGCDDVEEPLDNHLLKLGSDIGFFDDLGDDRVRDVFGVTWDRSIDKDIGNVEGCVLPEPSLGDYQLPDPLDQRFFCNIPEKIDRFGDRFRDAVFHQNPPGTGRDARASQPTARYWIYRLCGKRSGIFDGKFVHPKTSSGAYQSFCARF